MKKILERLFEQQKLSSEEANKILSDISDGIYTPEEVSAFLTVFRMRSITVEELVGFRNCLKERSLKVAFGGVDTVDLCGTGGDGKDTFNISTLASFIVAGSGLKVTKHGNYGVSSICGSSNVLQHLGVSFTNDSDTLNRQLEKSNICFLHAPLFHPAMKAVAPIRKSIGVKTFFNILGPMVNPASPSKQLVGVFSLQLQRYYKYIYETENINYRIVHALDGYDEISLTGDAKVISPEADFILSSADISDRQLTADMIKGGKTIKSSAEIFTNILEGKGSIAQNKVVIANAAMAIDCFNENSDYSDSLHRAQQSLESGAALDSFQKLLSI